MVEGKVLLGDGEKRAPPCAPALPGYHTARYPKYKHGGWKNWGPVSTWGISVGIGWNVQISALMSLALTTTHENCSFQRGFYPEHTPSMRPIHTDEVRADVFACPGVAMGQMRQVTISPRYFPDLPLQDLPDGWPSFFALSLSKLCVLSLIPAHH